MVKIQIMILTISIYYPIMLIELVEIKIFMNELT